MPAKKKKNLGNASVTVVEARYENGQLIVVPEVVHVAGGGPWAIRNLTDDCLRWYVPVGPLSSTKHHCELIPARGNSRIQGVRRQPGKWHYVIDDVGAECPKTCKVPKRRFDPSDPVIIIDDTFSSLTAAQRRRRARARLGKRKR